MHGMGWVRGVGCLALAAACGGGSPMEGQTDGATGTQSETTQDTAPTTGASGMSQSGTSTGDSGMSASQSDTGTSGDTTVDVTITGPDTTAETTNPTTLDTGDGTSPETSISTSSGDTSGGSESSGDTSGSSGSGSSGSGDTSSGESSTGEPCVPTEEICNDLDDDCDNIVDDVDVGMDGICDCLSIALVGNQGSNPSAEFQMWLQDQGTTVERINSNVMNDVNTPLTPAVLAKYDIVILDYLQRSYSAQEASDVRVWIEGGAGLMSMTGHVGNQAAADRPNSILSTMGLTYNTSAGFFSGPITQFVMHPITEGLTSITFLGGLFVDIVDDGVGMNQVIMTLPPGPVGVVQDRVDGRVFVFGDEWVEFDSEWQNMAQIKQFWVQTLAYLGPKDSCLLPQ